MNTAPPPPPPPDWPDVVEEDDPLAWYQLNETSNVVWQDSSGNNNHIESRTTFTYPDMSYTEPSLVGGAGNSWLIVPDPPGEIYQQERFMDAGTEVRILGAEATIQTATAAKMVVVWIGRIFGMKVSLLLGVTAAGKGYAELLDATGTHTVTGTSTVNDDTPHHLCATKDDGTSTLTLYVDGVNEGTYTYGAQAWVDSDWQFLTDPYPRDPYTGGVDEIVLWDRTLTAGEVAEHAAAVHGGTGPPPPPIDPSGLHFVGISSSREGLEGGETHKRAETMERYDEMAAEIGVTGAALRAVGGRHVYDTSNTPQNALSKIAAASHVVSDGFGIMMLTSSQWTGVMAGLAAGSYDSTITALWDSKPDTMILIHNVFHEPSNNGWSSTQMAQWRQIQARLARLAWLRDDDTVYYTTCYIPAHMTEDWNWIPELEALDPANADAISARTFLGLDPYPQFDTDGTPQTLAGRCNTPMTYWRSRGHTGPLCFPEVALFHWKGADVGGSPVSQTGAQQAARLHDELVTWGLANGLAAYFYFDVSAPDSPRSQTRHLNTPEELEEYGKQIRGDYWT